MNPKEKLNTENENTWCPGCPNFFILESVKRALAGIIDSGVKHEEIAITAGIGCHAKIFDYLNISGVYGLHGRPIPTAIGIKIGNPKLKVLAFAGDGDTYDEGMSHFIHACRYNSDITLIVHDNQTFALTTGQATASSQEGFKNKVEPKGEFLKPLNPILLALSAGASFIARCNPKDIPGTVEILEKAIKHKGFSFVEILQPCLQFNLSMNDVDEFTYKIQDNKNKEKAFKLAREWDYNSLKAKIPVGIFYQEDRDTLEQEIWK